MARPLHIEFPGAVYHRGIGKAVLEHGYIQREVADHLRIHFTSVSRILRAKDGMLRK